MSTGVNLAKQAVHDKLESRIKAVEAKLDSLRARAEVVKAHIEIKAIAELGPDRELILPMPQELKKSEGDRWEQAKADLESAIADLEASAETIESRAKKT